jgi:hypothetical protein
MKRVFADQSGVDFGDTTTSRFSGCGPQGKDSRKTSKPSLSIERRGGREPEGATLKDLSVEERAKIGKLIEQLAEAKEQRERTEAEREALAKDLRQSTGDFQNRLAEAVAACRRMEEALRQREEIIASLETEKASMAQRLEKSEAERGRLERQLEDAINRAERLAHAQREKEIVKENGESLNRVIAQPKAVPEKRPKVRKLIEPSLGKTMRLLQQGKGVAPEEPSEDEIEMPLQPIPKEPARTKRTSETLKPSSSREKKVEITENPKKLKPADPLPPKKSVSNLMQRAKQIRQNQSRSIVKEASPPRLVPPAQDDSDSDSNNSYLDHFIQKNKQRSGANRKPIPSVDPKSRPSAEPDEGFVTSPHRRSSPLLPKRSQR